MRNATEMGRNPLHEDRDDMTIEKMIERPDAEQVAGAEASGPEQRAASRARRNASQIDEFLASIEPFFYGKAITYVDAGAHKGDLFREIVERGPKLRSAWLIEPNPTSFAALEETVAALAVAPKTTCLNLAVSDRAGTVSLRDADTMTRVVDPAAGSADADDLPARIFEAEAATLDAIAARFDRPRITLLKIDVEGHEAAVLEGAAGLLAEQAVDMIYIEAGMNPEGGQQTYYRVIEDLLGAHGYRLFRIFEQKHEWQEDSPFLRRVNLAFMSPRFAAAHPYRLSADLLEARKENATLAAALKTAQAERKEAAGRVAAARDELAELRTAAARHAEEAEAAAAAREELSAALAEAQAARRQADDRLAGVEASRAKDVASLKRRFEEIAKLTGLLEDERRKRGGATAETFAELTELRDYARALEARHGAVLDSATWRAMEPVRRALRTLKGRKPPPVFVPRLDGPADEAKKKS